MTSTRSAVDRRMRPVDFAASAQQIRRLHRLMLLLLVLADVAVLVIAVLAAIGIRQLVLGTAGDLTANVADAAWPIALGWLLAIALFRGYDMRLLPAGTEVYSSVLLASLAAAGIVGTAVFLTGIELSRAVFVVLFLVGPPLLLLDRLILRRALNAQRRHGRFREGVIAIGPLHHIDHIARTLHRERWLGYDVIGALTPSGDEAETSELGIPVLGHEQNLLEVAESLRPSVILFTNGSSAGADDFRRIAWKLEDSDTSVIVAPAVSEIASERVRMRPVAGLPLVHVDPPRSLHSLRWTKRTFDVVVSALAILLLAPVALVTALRIRRHDGGPVIFRQQRVGRGGEEFEFLKFRTMVTDAEAVRVEMVERAVQDRGNAVMFKMRDDPRITRPGRFLRRYSLDELPQLWNVLRGDMSLVGPRPALPDEVSDYDQDALRRLSVRPGITGLWQVSGRSDLSWGETVRLDLFYVDNWSFLRDLQILLRTVRAVLASSGAY